MLPKRFSRQQKQALCHLDIQAIYLFGSRALEIKNPLADYDYAVLTQETGHSKGDHLYFKLYSLLSEVSPRSLEQDVIDIIFLRDVGIELGFHVIRYGKIIFEKDPLSRIRFEAHTTLFYCDFRPLLDQFDHLLLESL